MATSSTLLHLHPPHGGVVIHQSVNVQNVEQGTNTGCGGQHLSMADKIPHQGANNDGLVVVVARRPNSEPPRISPDSSKNNLDGDDIEVSRRFERMAVGKRWKRNGFRLARSFKLLGRMRRNEAARKKMEEEKCRLDLKGTAAKGSVKKNKTSGGGGGTLLRPSRLKLSKETATAALRDNSSSAVVCSSPRPDSPESSSFQLPSKEAIVRGGAACDVKSEINAEKYKFSSAASRLSVNGLSQSLQDFSTCCRELETFSLDDANKVRAASSKSQSGSQKRRSRKKRRSGEDILADYNLGCGNIDDDDALASSQNKKEKESRRRNANSSSSHVAVVDDVSVDDLAGYLEDSMVFPKKMSYMAEMMYT